MMKTLLVAALLIAMGAGLAACNTLDGMGKDFESAGRTMQDTF
jgi:predicted small secreted protein